MATNIRIVTTDGEGKSKEEVVNHGLQGKARLSDLPEKKQQIVIDALLKKIKGRKSE